MAHLSRISDEVLDAIERDHEDGISSVEILDIFATHDIKFSEATLRKYVQLGLLPRSIRVGRKGKHQGSQGLYPAIVIRQILRIKEMTADDLTIEQIQREFLFVRGDIEELERVLGRIFENLGKAAKERGQTGGRSVTTDLAGARSLARDLLHKLESIEARLTARAELARSAAG